MYFRSPRLTTLFGAPPESATFEQLAALVGVDAAAEQEDLDYKLEYKAGPEGTEDIAIDIATFANHRGGVIIVGMAEANARPAVPKGVELTDALRRRILTAAADRIFPTPQFEMREVPDPDSQGNPRRGLLLIIVPPSGNAPHAVINPGAKDKLAYPRRQGSRKVWLTESEVAAAYRRRFTAVADQRTRLANVETDAIDGIERLDRSDPGALLVVSLVPEVPGEFSINRDTYNRFRRENQEQELTVGSNALGELNQTGVGHRRLIASAPGGWHNTRAELHSDGAGSLATQLPAQAQSETEVRIWDSSIVMWVASALRYLARHSRDRTGASGVAATTATLLPYAPMANARSELGGTAVIVTQGSFTGARVYGGEPQKRATGQVDFLLDDLADGGQSLAAATAALTGDLFQAFNIVDIVQISREGVLQRNGWDDREWDRMRTWATRAGIPTEPPLTTTG
ncbi:AlbA family DNA-binding domain-containing protein [Microbispora bryophytorum]|uniref:AlbA family DNA-binding domain-containing protein n=1 Tax=Microbispora bryophytorum TaxID=1460882 RepID=UPI0033C87389